MRRDSRRCYRFPPVAWQMEVEAQNGAVSLHNRGIHSVRRAEHQKQNPENDLQEKAQAQQV